MKLKISNCNTMETVSYTDINRCIEQTDRIRKFNDQVRIIEKENREVFGVGRLNNFFRLTQAESITINFTNNSISPYLKDKVITAFMKIFTSP